MKLRKLFTVLALAAGFTATAATPVAVWEGFAGLETTLDSKEGNHTLTKVDGTVENGVYAVGANGGLTIAPKSGNFGYQATVIMDVEEIPTGSSDRKTLIDLYIGGSNKVLLDSVNSKFQFYWNGTTYGSSVALPTGGIRHRVAMTYNGSGKVGESVYVDGVKKTSGGAYSSNTAIPTIAIGAKGGNAQVAANMKVYNIAIFSTPITDAEVAAYMFPGDIDDDKLYASRVAAWNRDLADGSTKGAFTMTVAPSPSYATIADGVVTVKQKSGSGKDANAFGVKIDWPEKAVGSKDMSFLVKYSSRTLLGGNSALLAAYWGNANAEFLYSGKSDNTMMGTKSVTADGYSGQLTASSFTMPSAGVMLATMKADGTTMLAFAEYDGSAYGPFKQALGYNASNTARSNAPFYGIKIAGTLAQLNHYYRPDMVVEGVVLMKAAYTAANFPASCIEEAFTRNIDYVVPTDYYATMNGDTSATSADWSPEKTGAFNPVDTLTITNKAVQATFTADEDIAVTKLTIVSPEDTLWVFKKNAGVTTDFGALDFSEAVEGVGYDCTEGFTACNLLLDYARTHDEKFFFFGEGDNGATIDYGTAEKNYTFAGHYVFDDGMHTFQNNSNGQNVRFGANATVDNPTFWVKNGATLNFVSRNPCGWKVAANDDGIVRIGGASKVKLSNSLSGTWYWAQQFYLEPGSELEIATGQMCFSGGTNGAAQVFMPASDAGVATMSASGSGSFRFTSDTPGTAVNVGDGSTLLVTAPLATTKNTIPLAKFGEGTLKLTGALNDFAGKMCAMAGTLALAPTSFFNAGAELVVAAGACVTIDPKGGTLTVGSKISGAGDIVVNSSTGTGAVKFTGDLSAFSGTITYENGSYDIGEDRAFSLPACMTLADGVTVAATQTRVEYGKGQAVEITGLPDGRTVVFTRLDGTTASQAAAEGKVAFPAGSPKIDGAACLFDVTFTNLENASQFAYKAVPGAVLQYDTTATFADPGDIKERGVYIKHHPYINGAASTFNGLTDFTAVFVGEMSPTANRIFIHFGSCTSGNQGLLIATTADKDGVAIFSNTGSALTELKTLSVPNSATARHVYIVTKKDDATHSVFTIYLDGVKKAEVAMDGLFKLGSASHSGLQVGADFGGTIRTGTYKAVANEPAETGVLNVMRVYDYSLTDAQVTQITTEYPYHSEGGLYTRSVEGAVDYAAANTWAKDPATEPEYEVPTGTDQFSPSATLTGTGDGAAVTVNTNSVIDTFTFNGAAMTFAKDAGGTNKIIVSTAVVNAPITIEYGALDLSSATVALSGDGAITFDLSGFDLGAYFKSTVIQFTGMTDQKDDKITVTGLKSVAGRTPDFAYDGGEYYLTITVDDLPFVYNEGWTFAGLAVSERTVDAHPDVAIHKEGEGTLVKELGANRIYVVNGGVFQTTNAVDVHAAVAVNAGATFDFNGSVDGFVAVTLNGGSLINNGTAMGTNNRQMSGIVQTTASTVGGTGNFGLISNQLGANVLNLGYAKLTKTGANTFYLCNTLVTNGIFDVTGGALEVVGSSTFANNAEPLLEKDAALVVDAGQTLTAARITANGATIDNAGTISAFTLTGAATLTGNGTWGTITNAANAVATIGTKRNFTFAGAGTVNVTLTAAEIAQRGVAQTVFEVESGSSVKVGVVRDEAGNDITSTCTISGGTVTVKKLPFMFILK